MIKPMNKLRVFIILAALTFLNLRVYAEDKYGKLNITTEPAGAMVVIDGHELGQTPIKNQQIKYGRHTLRFKIGKLESVEETFVVDKNNAVINLYHPFAIMRLQGKPPDAQVHVGDLNIPGLPTNYFLIPYGTYDVSVRKAGYSRFSQNHVVLNQLKIYKQNIELKPRNRWMCTVLSTFLPGSGQYYAARTKGVWLGYAAISGAITSTIMYQQYLSARTSYLDNSDKYWENNDVSLMTELYDAKISSYDDMKSKYKAASITIGITAAVWLYNIFDAYWFFPKQQPVTIGLQAEPYPGVSLGFRW